MTAPAPDRRSWPAWSAVVINWNGAADLPDCLAALAGQAWPPAEIVVVDNASGDDSLEILAGGALPANGRLIASPTNLGFAGGANAGIRATGSPLVATVNPDVAVRPDWSARLAAAFAAEPGLGAAGGKLLFPDGVTIQHAGGRVERPALVAANIGRGEADHGQYDAPAEVAFLTGAALMLRRTALDGIGLFDEAFFPAYYEDVDLCLRLRRAGWAVRYLPGAVGRHRESASVDGASAAYYRMIHAGRLRFAAKHLPLGELVGRYLPDEAARLSLALQHATGPAAPDQTGRSVFPDALLKEQNLAAAQPPGATGPIATFPNSPHLAGQPPVAAGAPTPPTRPSLLDHLAEVGRRWLVEERPFTSAAPLVAPLIVWLRARLIDAGPRWHVRQILAQQVEFNAAVYRALAGVTAEAQAARLADQASAALLVEHLETLASQQAALVERLAALEQRLDAVRAADESPPGTAPDDPASRDSQTRSEGHGR